MTSCTEKIVVLAVLAAGCGTEDPADDGAQTDASASATAGTGGDPDARVVNPGFEQNMVAPGGLFLMPPTGWRAHDPGSILNGSELSVGVLNPTGTTLYPDGAPEGDNVALVFLWDDASEAVPTGLSQVLSTRLEADQRYTLRVQVGNIAPTDAPFDLDGFPGYRVELYAGQNLLVADEDGVRPGEGEFLPTSITYTSSATDAGLGAPLEIRLVNLARPASGIEVNFDDVELEVSAAP